jgi:predicted HAD superfamily hydrolase
MKKKNILFYLEPSIEFNNKYFRYSTLRNVLLPQFDSLKNNEKFNILFILSKDNLERAISENYIDDKDIDKFIGIDSLEWQEYYDGNELGIQLQCRNDKIIKEKIIEKLKTIIPEEFVPDLIISWESPADFFKDIFEDVKILYEHPGIFSRPPYPSFIFINEGLLSNYNETFNLEDKIEIKNKELDDFVKFKKDIYDILNIFNPVKNFKKLNKFKHKILFPLQVDNYFMINCNIKEKNQLEILIKILEETPEDIGIVVTNYKSKDIQTNILTDEIINYLENKYKNFIYLKEFDNIPNISQFLVLFVDGVFTISSSVGFQAVLWEKPLYTYTLNKNHISLFSTAKNYNEFLIQVKKNKKVNQDKKLIKILKYQNIDKEFIYSNNFADFIEKYIDNKTKGYLLNSKKNLLYNYLKEKMQINNFLKELNNCNFFDKEKICPELIRKIDNFDIISFDLFDTLLYRPVLSPINIFEYIEEKIINNIDNIELIDFVNYRRKAEKIAFEENIKKGIGEVNIDEIYKKFRILTNLNKETVEKIKNIEIKVEKKFIYTRQTGINAYRYALLKNKKIIFISDMYLPKDVLESILEKNGINKYDRFFLSNIHKKKKHSGEIYKEVIKHYDKSKILHIGDNIKGDIKEAEKWNINTFYLKKSMDVAKETRGYKIWEKNIDKLDVDFKFILGIIFNKFFDNPCINFHNKTLFNGSAFNLGYAGLGPLLLGFVKWLIEDAIENGIENLYFLSRDGKIMKDAYDILSKYYKNAPKSYYLLCSRRNIHICKIKSMKEIIDILNIDIAYGTSLGFLLENRFNINKNEFEKILEKVDNDYKDIDYDTKVSKENLSRILSFIQKYFYELILKKAEEQRILYLEYLKEQNLFSNKKKAVVDIGYAGTMQEGLYKITNEKIAGYYLITFQKAVERIIKKGLIAKGFLGNFIDRHNTFHPFPKYVPLYETLFSTEETSFIKIIKKENKLVPIFAIESKKENIRKKIVKKNHEGAIEFINDTINIFEEDLKEIYIEANKVLKILDVYFKEPHPRDAEIFEGIVFEDNYGGAGIKTILPIKKEIHNNCVWKEGQKVLIKDINIRNNLKNDEEIKIKENLFIDKLFLFFLKDKKYKKFKYKKVLFFKDSNKPLVKLIGKLFYGIK